VVVVVRGIAGVAGVAGAAGIAGIVTVTAAVGAGIGDVDELAVIGAGHVLDDDAVDEAADEGEDVEARQPEGEQTSRQGGAQLDHVFSVATAAMMSTRDRPP
jgi:hypothetical protein